MKRYAALGFAIFLTSCTAGETQKFPVELAQPVDMQFQTPIPTETAMNYDEAFNLEIEIKDYQPAKYEPANGCYLGAYTRLDKTIESGIAGFEGKLGKKHAIYTYNMILGNEYPVKWVLECVSQLKTPNIVINPPNYYAPFNEELLIKTAQDIGELNVPVFVQFYPYSKGCNYTAEDYKQFFQRAHAVFERYAPNACMVWSVYFEDVYDSARYYPGDNCADWVGLSIYNDVSADGKYKDIDSYIDYFYYSYQKTKPIMFSELAVSHYTLKNNAYFTAEAAKELTDIYGRLAEAYPRVKAVLYMNYNGTEQAQGNTANDYMINTEDLMKTAYTNAIAPEHFLQNVNTLSNGTIGITIQSPFQAYEAGGEYYIAHNALLYDMDFADLDLLAGKEVLIEGDKYYSMQNINNVSGVDFYVDLDKHLLVLR